MPSAQTVQKLLLAVLRLAIGPNQRGRNWQAHGQETAALSASFKPPSAAIDCSGFHYLAGKRLPTKSASRCAAGGSKLASTATTYPDCGYIVRSPFMPGAPPPWPKE